MTRNWWDLRQTLIWIATREAGWVDELAPKVGLFGREAQRDAFGYDFAAAREQRALMEKYKGRDGETGLKADLIDAIAGGRLTAVEDGVRLRASEFQKARVGDDYVGTHHTGYLCLYRFDWTYDGAMPVRGDVPPPRRPLFLAEQVRHVFPPIASEPQPISEAGNRLLEDCVEVDVEPRVAADADPQKTVDVAADTMALMPAKVADTGRKPSLAIRRGEARKWYAEKRVVDWTGSRRGPKAAEDFIELKNRFALGRKDARRIRDDLAPLPWKEPGPKDDEA